MVRVFLLVLFNLNKQKSVNRLDPKVPHCMKDLVVSWRIPWSSGIKKYNPWWCGIFWQMKTKFTCEKTNTDIISERGRVWQFVCACQPVKQDFYFKNNKQFNIFVFVLHVCCSWIINVLISFNVQYFVL